MSFDKRRTIIGDDFFDPDDPSAVFQNQGVQGPWGMAQNPTLRTGGQINAAPAASVLLENLGFEIYGEGSSRSFDKRVSRALPASLPTTGIGDDSFLEQVVGAYTGSHTIADCLNLEANYDKWIKELGDQFSGLMAAWKNKAPDDEKAWGLDYNGLSSRWSAAKQAVTEATSSILPNSTTAAESQYQGLIRALRQGGEGQPLQKGDFEDLRNRLVTAAQAFGVTVKLSTPTQPTAGPTDPNWRGLGGINTFGKVPAIPWDKVILAGGILAALLITIEVVPALIMAKAVSGSRAPRGSSDWGRGTRFYRR